nr:hypothetical protein CFP56_71044 [Quercus suber]
MADPETRTTPLKSRPPHVDCHYEFQRAATLIQNRIDETLPEPFRSLQQSIVSALSMFLDACEENRQSVVATSISPAFTLNHCSIPSASTKHISWFAGRPTPLFLCPVSFFAISSCSNIPLLVNGLILSLNLPPWNFRGLLARDDIFAVRLLNRLISSDTYLLRRRREVISTSSSIYELP